MNEPENLQNALEKARRYLFILEEQAAAYGSVTIPAHLKIELEDQPKKIAELQAQLNKPIHTYLTRILEEFERYEDTTNIVFPALKPGTTKEKKGAKREEERLRAYLSNFDPKYSPSNPETFKPNEQAQEEQLEAFLLKKTRVALLGDPGAGKSTALRGLFREYTQRWEQDSSQRIPLFATLNRWQETETLLDFLQKETPELAASITSLLKDGRILLLLDGLNELPNLKRNKETNEINDPRSSAIAALSGDYPQTLCLLSCRVKEFVGGPTWCDLHVLPLRRAQVEAIVHTYFHDEPEKATQLIVKLYEGKLEKLQTLAEKPFYLKRLLAYFGATGEIPANPALLLAYSVDTAIYDEINKGLLKAEEREELKERLSLLAFNMTEARKVSTSQEQAAGWLFYLRGKPGQFDYVEKEPEANAKEMELAEIWLRHGEACGLRAIQGGEIKFAHQLLLEYFCALFMKKQGLIGIWLKRLLFSFDEVWLLFSGIDNSLVERLIQTFKDENSIVQRDAAFVLGKIGDTRAVEPLILALNDKEWLGRSAVSALGNIGDTRAIEPIIQFLTNKVYYTNDYTGEMRKEVVHALLKIGISSIEPLILALKDDDSDMPYTAVSALGLIGLPAVEPLILALKDDEKNVRQCAARALGEISDTRAVEPLILALNDEKWLVRANTASALGLIGDARALSELEQLAQVDKGKINWHSNVCELAYWAIEQIKVRQQSQR